MRVGASPGELVTGSEEQPSYAPSYPFGGDWVGYGFGSETRFKQSRREFVAQFSPRLAATAGGNADAVLMSLSVKHQAIFRFHVDAQGSVTGRGAIVYTLDPDLCAVAVLTRQVNEQVNLMKYLPAVYLAAGKLAALTANRFNATWSAQRTTFTRFIERQEAAENALKQARVTFTTPKLQHVFKHAPDFGITGNANAKTLATLQAEIERHVLAPSTRAIVGEYRGLKGVTHFIDPVTKLNVIRNKAGVLESAWKLSDAQWKYVMTIGKLGGGS